MKTLLLITLIGSVIVAGAAVLNRWWQEKYKNKQSPYSPSVFAMSKLYQRDNQDE